MKTKPELYRSDIIDELLNGTDPMEAQKVEKRMLMAKKIADAMRAKGWKKKDLMEAMDKNNQSIVTKWLSGTHNFNMDTLMDLERVLDIKLIDVKSEKDVVSTMFVQVTQKPQPVIYSSNYFTQLIKDSTSLSMVKEQKTYYGKLAEA